MQWLKSEPIAEGCFRRVYVNPLKPDTVLKEEIHDGKFCNVEEWAMWQEYREHELGKWLAPCMAISPNGRWLVQAKTRTLMKLPERIPAIFADLKRENWGLYRGRPVCHDYGSNLSRRYPTRLVKANWWS